MNQAISRGREQAWDTRTNREHRLVAGRADRAGRAQCAGVVDQGVDDPEPFGQSPGEGDHLAAHGEVGQLVADPFVTGEGLDSGDGLLGLCRPSADHHRGGATAGERAGGGQSDATRSAGDHDHLVAEFVRVSHVCSLPRDIA